MFVTPLTYEITNLFLFAYCYFRLGLTMLGQVSHIVAVVTIVVNAGKELRCYTSDVLNIVKKLNMILVSCHGKLFV